MFEQPHRVHAKSTREFAAPKPTDLAIYYSMRRAPSSFHFSRMGLWKQFDEMMVENLARISYPAPPTERILATTDMALVYIAPILRRNNVDATFLTSGMISLIGDVDLALCIGSDTPVLIGQHHNSEQLSLSDGGESPTDNPGVANAILKLVHTMLLNDVAHGVLSTDVCMRFVVIRISSQNSISASDVQRNRDLEVSVSRPVAREASELAFLAVCLQGYFGQPHLHYKDGFELITETVQSPDILPLSSYEAVTAGRVKWWIANRACRQEYRLHVDRQNTGGGHGVHYTGLITVLNSTSTSSIPAYLILKTSEESLRAEASMYEYLDSRKLACVPRRIIYGHLLGHFHVLALYPFGRPLERSDLQDSYVVEAMGSALAALHECNVLHRNICLSSFYIDPSDNTLRIVSFSAARLYRRLPEIARQTEMQALCNLIKDA